MKGVLVWILMIGMLAAEELSVIRAKVGLPVLDELMGGCSLTCAFPWQASSGKRGQSAAIAALNDESSTTAWTTARVGDRLEFRFPPNLPRDLNGTPFYGIEFANGRLRPVKDFKHFGRLKTVRLFHNGKPIYDIRLADSWRWQEAGFPDIYLHIGDTLALEIVEIYPGEKADTAALTEIVLQGAH